jgi:hypothetical protein
MPDGAEAALTDPAPAFDYHRESGRRVLIVGQFDGYANGRRSEAIRRFLEQRGHRVTTLNTYFLSRFSAHPGSPLRRLPRPGFRRFVIYLVELASLLMVRKWSWGRRHLSAPVLRADFQLRRSLLKSIARPDDFDLVMVQEPHDAGLLLDHTSARTFYDCPTPWADELFYEGRLTARQHARLRKAETRLFETVDVVSFHWQSYANYVRRFYGGPLTRLVQLDWGCEPVAPGRRAGYDTPLRIVYIGSLSSRFIDLALLARLSRIYPVDVYGGPAPDPSLGLRYLGWADPEVLSEYQVGLITCTQDALRCEGFSAKHLHYISYGLPVLVPRWRRHLDLIEGSVPYDESSFADVVADLAAEATWRDMSDAAYDQAQRLTWESTLAPLENLLRGM